MRIFTLTTALVMFSYTWLAAFPEFKINKTTVAPANNEWDDFTACNFANAQTNSTTAVCVLCSVQNAANTTDTDTSNFSVLTVPLAAGSGSVQQSLIFPTAYTAGSKVKIMLELPAQVLDNALLSSVEVSSFNGATPNNDAQLANSGLVQITPVSGSAKFSLLF